MKKSFISKAIIFTSIAITPLITFAEGGVTVRDAMVGIGTTAILIQLFTSTVVKALATLALSVALLAFFYGIVEYIWAKRNGDAGGVKGGGDFIKWSLMALFVMFSVYGIIKLGQGILFQGKDVTKIDIPSFNFGPSGSSNTNSGLPSAPSSPGATNSGVPAQSTPGATNSGTPSSAPFGAGADCVTDGECNNGLTCYNYKCQMVPVP
ncbi:hypothetical protein K9M47_00165 [Candidatus Gracilibacteria bacterium]|nr:hypothetical protein [Candidatus Gracilibacteria bacterium]MCF7898391.1 hypothetical protein [Candidatus Paceibacterota bacterium]